MGYIAPDPDRLRAFLAEDDGQPVVMINLLRFRAQAAYPESSGHEPCTGVEAYQRYGEAATPLLREAGARVIWRGSVHALPIGPNDEDWDEAILVEYPSRKAFIDMVSSDAYQALTVHRTAALADSRLIATRTEASESATIP